MSWAWKWSPYPIKARRWRACGGARCPIPRDGRAARSKRCVMAYGLSRRAEPGRAKRAPAGDSLSDRAVRNTAQTLIAPLWRRHLERILTREPDFDALLFLTVPLNHLVGVPGYVRDKFDLPVFYFDGDVPASLPNMKGFASGFRIYPGADLSEYTAFISNSGGGEDLLRQLGAKRAHTVWYGRGPRLIQPGRCAGARP